MTPTPARASSSMPNTVTVTAPAKVNLCLGVGGLRRDGFHALATVYQAVGLYDQVTVRNADEVSVSVRADARLSVEDVPTDESNTAVRAVRLLARHRGVERAARVIIEKSIPVAGGMAGGSADGAATLLACDHLWGLTRREDCSARSPRSSAATCRSPCWVAPRSAPGAGRS